MRQQRSALNRLEQKLKQATGPSKKIDRDVSALRQNAPQDEAVVAYTASVDDCIALINDLLPEWHWHVGHGPMGIFPYASMSLDDGKSSARHFEAKAPTVPLALLGVLVKALKGKKQAETKSE